MSDSVAEDPCLSILIVSFNTRDVIGPCLGSVAAQTRATHEVIVVDNASSDDSVAYLEEGFPEVRVFALAHNVGFGRAVNYAAEQARGEFVVLLNPDATVEDHALDHMLAHARAHPEHGVIGGRAFRPDGSDSRASCWNDPSLWGQFSRGIGLAALFPDTRWGNPERVQWSGEAPREVDIVAGCLLQMRRDDWLELGGFDPRFFMYGEDFDLCRRARLRGLQACVVPDAVIIHVGGASERVHSDKLVRLFRAKAQYFDAHWSAGRAALGRACLLLWAGSRALAYRLRELLRRGSESAGTWAEVWSRRGEYTGARAIRRATPVPLSPLPGPGAGSLPPAESR